MTDGEISRLSKYRFRKLVNDAVHKVAFITLVNDARKHSKSLDAISNMKGDELETQPYLLTTQLTSPQKVLLFSLRCKMYDVKANFKNKYGNSMICRSCKAKDSYENITHLISCYILVKDVNPMSHGFSVDDIFGGLEKQIVFVKFFEKIHTKRMLLQEFEGEK